MVKLDESNIPINWFCPPCDRLENPEKYKNNSTTTDKNSTTAVAATTPVTNSATKGKISLKLWLRNRLISAGLESVLSHTENLFIASYNRQFSTNIEL